MKASEILISGFIVIALVSSCANPPELNTVSTNFAPKAIGPYSQAVCYGNLIFLSGQIGLHPETGEMQADIESQTKQVLENLKQVLKAAFSDVNHVAKTTIYLTDMKDYAVVNSIYEGYFQGTKPARATVQVAALPKGALVEIECIAVKISHSK